MFLILSNYYTLIMANIYRGDMDYSSIPNFTENDDWNELLNYYRNILSLVKILWNCIDRKTRKGLSPVWNHLKTGPHLCGVNYKRHRLFKTYNVATDGGVSFTNFGFNFSTDVGELIPWVCTSSYTHNSMCRFEGNVLKDRVAVKQIRERIHYGDGVREDRYYLEDYFKVGFDMIPPLKGFYLSDTKRLAWIEVLKKNKINNDASYKAFLEGL